MMLELARQIAEKKAAENLIPYRVYRFQSGKGEYASIEYDCQPLADPLPCSDPLHSDFEAVASSFPAVADYESASQQAAKLLNAMANYDNARGCIGHAAELRGMAKQLKERFF